LIIVLMLAVLMSLTNPIHAARLKINLIPCGKVPEAVLSHLEEGLRREFGAEVVRRQEVMVPESAYGPERRQYLADAFVNLAPPQGLNRQNLALLVTAADLYVPRLNFVFGLADTRRKAAVISLARLNPEFYGSRSNPALLNERALKEAVHELGHLLDLGHCSKPACIMFFSNTLADTDRKGPGFCPVCRKNLSR
jgi:archaemetzincin